jgi:hypothetical protein
MTVISIRPTIVDLELERGDAAPFTLTALDKAGGPLNLAGCQIALTMRKYLRGVWEDAPVAVALSWTEGNPNGISVSDLATMTSKLPTRRAIPSRRTKAMFRSSRM